VTNHPAIFPPQFPRRRCRLGWTILLVLISTWTAAAAAVHADVRLHPLFSDHVVLQRDVPTNLWGTAAPGERVAVRIADQEHATEAGGDGRWRVRLAPTPAGGPHTLTVQGTNRIDVRDVLFGEVWLASGQSNMHMLVRPNLPWSAGAVDYEKEIREADHPAIRVFDVQRQFAEAPAETCGGAWAVCSPETVGDFSATAYFFARALHRELNVPVGILSASVGATSIGAWTSRDAMEREPSGKPKLVAYDARVREYAQAASNEKPPATTRPAKDPLQDINSPTLLFNGMIAPLMPYAIRGTIWYQGESDAKWHAAYDPAFRTMVDDWRARWGQGDFPFLFVQLTARGPRATEPADDNWAHMRESQAKCLTVPNTGMAVTIDVGAEDTTHPRNKQAVGQRLALIAMAKVYGRPVVYAGPTYRDMSNGGNAIRVRFDHVGQGLRVAGDRLSGFAIAGEDRRFVWAQAGIDGREVIVSSPQVARPVAVRYAWADNPECNLFNANGLPAVPFRTDDWPQVKSQP
jgi:sialate O-acetylesterase